MDDLLDDLRAGYENSTYRQRLEIVRRCELLVLDATADLPHTARASLALAIMAAVVMVSAVGWLPIAISATVGVLLM